MRVKKTLLFTLMAVLIVFTAQSALATLISGSTSYDDETISCTIHYAVFEDGEEFTGAWDLPTPGADTDHVYAYMIENDSDSSNIAYFAILGLTEGNTTSDMLYEDSGYTDAEEPYDAHLDTDESKGIWEWTDDDTYNYIQVGEYSWLLYFTSPSEIDYRLDGEFEISGPEGIAVPDVPEPSMIALFGLGSTALFRRRKKL